MHKETGSSNGVSFPDVPGVVTAADTIDDAMQRTAEVLEFAAEDWVEQVGTEFPQPRSIDDLRRNAEIRRDAVDAVIAAVPFRAKAEAAE